MVINIMGWQCTNKVTGSSHIFFDAYGKGSESDSVAESSARRKFNEIKWSGLMDILGIYGFILLLGGACWELTCDFRFDG